MLSPRQFRLAISTVVKVSPEGIATEILSGVLDRVKRDKTHDLTYLFAVVDSLPWLRPEEVDFWLNQVVWTAQPTGKEGEVRKRVWECISGEMGGETGLNAVQWWVNGGNSKLFSNL
jgi:hypothetical protein